MIINAEELDAARAYKLLIATVVPRPIAWISTLSTDGTANIAPFSFFTPVGRKPPMVSISMQPRADGVTLKDTFVNIRDTGEFVVNFVPFSLADNMHKSAIEYASEVDEFESLGIEKAPSVVVKPPRVALAPVAMECKLERIIPVGEDDGNVVWGRVVRFHVRDDLYNHEKGYVDTAALAPVGRLAAEYTLVDNVFTTPVDPELLKAREGSRMHRLDGRPTEWAASNQKNWSPSGSVMEEE
ncbi:flavin reductase family protein [Priestia megaterium]|jgi:flavin reductase (DIM6/NTAB) family NADH-FMN oxidoreductase RutF|uniref:flavin reductase family protein n=1 Tax=Priestia megaterium TaxID=1404 RepID=UPI0018666E0F|nr:flavin reductase family protein [Priestia megaterium]MBE2978338.1 flavin reductase family protein [Priestia megaterium]MED4286825.1 flavin reductase family protein [Priestia megaterium]MED4297840.1 flavin reductase family protein [Priestia megaterium]